MSTYQVERFEAYVRKVGVITAQEFVNEHPEYKDAFEIIKMRICRVPLL